MKKCISIIVLFLLCSHTSIGQDAIAKLKYEEAEEAYVKNNFRLVLNKLDEVEAILKSTNPKILYMRTKAMYNLFWKDQYNYDYAFLDKTRKMAAKYLKDYENLPDNEDKYKEIYANLENLPKFPKTLAESLNFKKTMKKQSVFFDSLFTVYKFRGHVSENEFKIYNKEAADLLMIQNDKDIFYYRRKKEGLEDVTYKINNQKVGPNLVYIKDNLVWYYKYNVFVSDNPLEVKTVHDQYLKLILANTNNVLVEDESGPGIMIYSQPHNVSDFKNVHFRIVLTDRALEFIFWSDRHLEEYL
jgi:hypothetical protein